jgi:hypothetical protein
LKRSGATICRAGILPAGCCGFQPQGFAQFVQIKALPETMAAGIFEGIGYNTGEQKRAKK